MATLTKDVVCSRSSVMPLPKGATPTFFYLVSALVCLAALLVLCVELNSSKSSNKSNRLVQKAQNFYYSEKAEGRIYEHPAVHGDPNNPDVFDQDHRGIRFVEGGRIRGKPEPVNANRDQEQDQDHVSIKPKKIVFQEDEIEYYKRKNKLLYAAKAEQAKVRNKLAKSKAKVHISHNNFQPYNEDETELGNGNEKDKYQVQSLNDNLPQPVYRYSIVFFWPSGLFLMLFVSLAFSEETSITRVTMASSRTSLPTFPSIGLCILTSKELLPKSLSF